MHSTRHTVIVGPGSPMAKNVIVVGVLVLFRFSIP